MTDMSTAIRENSSEEFLKSVNGAIPAERWGTADDFKGPVVFLSSDASDYVHGHSLVVRIPHLQGRVRPWSV